MHWLWPLRSPAGLERTTVTSADSISTRHPRPHPQRVCWNALIACTRRNRITAGLHGGHGHRTTYRWRDDAGHSGPVLLASADGTFPGVFNNAATDGHFGITSPIFLDELTTDGHRVGTLPIPTDQIVTSFSSKSELALHLSTDGKSLTFVGYRGGPGFPTAANIFDVSNGNTPGLIDPTNAAGSQYYRAVGEVDARGHLMITEGNAYSGDNGRGAVKGGSLYYLVGNDNSGNLSKSQVKTTIVGQDLVNDTGAELLVPGQAPPVPPNVTKIGKFDISQITDPITGMPYASDKPGKDDNYRGITIYKDTLYITKGSGGNGINTVYQVGTQGVLPSGDVATLAKVPITILPGFPVTLAAGADPTTMAATPVLYPFGIWFANPDTLYVCDEGDGTLVTPAVNGNVATPYAQATAGVQKWILVNGTWQMAYVMNSGLNIGVPYGVENYPDSAQSRYRRLPQHDGPAQRRRHGYRICGHINPQHQRRSGSRSEPAREAHRPARRHHSTGGRQHAHDSAAS